MDAGLLLARLAFGLLMAAHGSQKLFGWFGGYGLDGHGGVLRRHRLPAGPRSSSSTAAVSEVAGGRAARRSACSSPLAPRLMVAVMVVAAERALAATASSPTSNGIEVPLLYGVVAAALALTGPGCVLARRAARVDALLDSGADVEHPGGRSDRRRGQPCAQAASAARRGGVRTAAFLRAAYARPPSGGPCCGDGRTATFGSRSG